MGASPVGLATTSSRPSVAGSPWAWAKTHALWSCTRSNNGSAWALPTTRKARAKPGVPMTSMRPNCARLAKWRRAAMSSTRVRLYAACAGCKLLAAKSDVAPRRRACAVARASSARATWSASSAWKHASSYAWISARVCSAAPTLTKSQSDENFARASVNGAGSSRPARPTASIVRSIAARHRVASELRCRSASPSSTRPRCSNSSHKRRSIAL
mmetsp:Transcript_37793/g.103876  ORF Transcript_37793/g.103876 Transcript_37793/m.103876 type:complete len:214 (+) Transcript_37793:2294-2935(+)